jgi:hypothetical protein
MVWARIRWVLYIAAAVVVASGLFLLLLALYLGIGSAFPFLFETFWRYGFGRYIVAAVFGVVLVIVIVARR